MTADWLEGAIDVHVHTAPAMVDRAQDDPALARDALEAGLDAVVVKSHVVPTVGRVDAVNSALGEQILHGGITLNGSVGGLNPEAVETALELGAKIVWLPTTWARNHAARARAAGEAVFVGQRVPTEAEDLEVTNGSGVTTAVQRIIDLVAEYDAVLATGHISPTEIEAVVDACTEREATCLINHPFFRITDLSIEQQLSLAERGAVMEYCAYAVESTPGHTVDRVAEALERLGSSHCVLATDYGQVGNPAVPGLAEFATAVSDAGASETAVRRSLTDTPTHLIGL
ncbi:DUF6282 family protein [Natronorubrum bangense]|uniref:Cytosolic protein n=2 Tax=Natronorubrum bangense TaxID=61858 RepID=L9WC35_9EURY|nr:DUF6282 family protein [Natronorubrum bangense]ELY46999.1 hypothetical protein C494_13921 [Natronorubrum bangense JCM 10635]QCC56416.1 hypothetical protein DV706_17980 [Natronorubrum bangense]